MENTIENLEEKYDLELGKVVKQIKDSKAKVVLLQFPDGLKVYATAVVDFLREKTKVAPKGVHPNSEGGCKFLIWMGSCFGACDTPVLSKELEKQIDLVVQFGHNGLMPEY